MTDLLFGIQVDLGGMVGDVFTGIIGLRLSMGYWDVRRFYNSRIRAFLIQLSTHDGVYFLRFSQCYQRPRIPNSLSKPTNLENQIVILTCCCPQMVNEEASSAVTVRMIPKCAKSCPSKVAQHTHQTASSFPGPHFLRYLLVLRLWFPIEKSPLYS